MNDTPTTNRKPVRKATTAEIIKVNEILKERLNKLEAVDPEGNHLYRYKDNWDDLRVAHEVASDLPPTVVGRIRREMYGTLIGADKRDALCERVDRINNRLHHLEATVAMIAEQLGIKIVE